MWIIYAVGGYVTKLKSVPVQQIYSSFECCDSIEFFSDKNDAEDFQFKSADSEKCRVLFEVQVNLALKGAYVSRLIKSSVLKTQANVIEITLDYSLKPMLFLLTKKQCEDLGINYKQPSDKFITFLEFNNKIKEPSAKLPPELNSQIFSYYNQLVFVKEPPLKLTYLGFFTTAKNFINSTINKQDIYSYNKQKLIEESFFPGCGINY